MTEVTTIQDQSLIDLSVQEYGSNFLDGYLELLRNNAISPANNPSPGTILNISNRNQNDTAYLELKRNGVHVANSSLKEVLEFLALEDSDEAVLVDFDGAILIDV